MTPDPFHTTRRRFFSRLSSGLTGIALTRLLANEFSARATDAPWQPGKPQFAPKAKQILHIFCPGAASHIDLWDYKPMLEKFDGTPLPGEENFVSFQGKNGNLMKSPWGFAPAGKNGK